MNFTFEIIKQGRTEGSQKVLKLPDERAIWGCVEAMALRIIDPDGAVIRVKNSRGETVVRAGVATALASIETCTCVNCPLKGEPKQVALSDQQIRDDSDLRVDCPLLVGGRD